MDLDVEINWPDERKSLFNNDVKQDSKTYCDIDGAMSFSAGDFTLANSFKMSADHLISHIEYGGHGAYPDNLFRPIAYLYRHSLELSLKELLKLGIKIDLIDDSEPVREKLGKHNLIHLWQVVKPAIIEFSPGEDKRVLNNTEALINDFHKMDKTGQNLRYSKTINNTSTTAGLPNGIDLLDFKDAFEAIHNLIHGCISAFNDALSNMLCEM